MTNAPAIQIYDQILKDLDEAAAVLPASYSGADVGRATKWAALSYKARAALFAGRYQIAADAAKQVIDGNVFSLHPNYGQLFSYAGEGSKESIFARMLREDERRPIGAEQQHLRRVRAARRTPAPGRVVPIQQSGRLLPDDGRPADHDVAAVQARTVSNAAGTMFSSIAIRGSRHDPVPGRAVGRRMFDSRPVGLSTKPEAINLQNENVSVTGFNIRKYIDITDKA